MAASPIPLVMITVGGLCVLSGLKKTNPIALVKDALSGTPVPGNQSLTGDLPYGEPVDFGGSRTDTSANPTGAGSANSAEHDAPDGYNTTVPKPVPNRYNQKAV